MCNKSDIWLHILKDSNKISNETELENENIEIYITAKNIKEAKYNWKGNKNQFEPRLLTKYDSKKSRPNLFKKHKLTIIPINNGNYLISKTDIYQEINYQYLPFINFTLEKYDGVILNTLNELKGESNILDKLQYSGILDKIIGEKVLQGPLMNGRHRVSFDAIIGNKKLNIKGVQCEIDGVFESENIITLVEVKSKILNDFNIKQLYYPFKNIYDKINNKKKIYCLFIQRDNKKNIFIYKYYWEIPNQIDSIKCIQKFHIKY